MNTTHDNQLIEFTDTPQTMTSIEIAQVTGKNHFDVLKAIRKMEPAWEKVTARKFTCCQRISELANGVKKENPYYVLTKTECLYVATKFNDEARARLVIRWEQLEQQQAQQTATNAIQQPATACVMPALTRRQLLMMALEAEEENQWLREKNRVLDLNMIYMGIELSRRYDIIQHYAPQVLHLVSRPDYEPMPEQPGGNILPSRLNDSVACSLATAATAIPPAQQQARSDTFTATQLANEYGMKAISFNNPLQKLGVQHNVGGRWVIAADYAGHGFTATKHITVTDGGQPRKKPFTVWTADGRRFIHDTLARQGIRTVAETNAQQKKGGAA